jgi:tungstate transport system substrate-binding protein
LATTTSVRDAGLLEQILPQFEASEHCRVDVIAVGTGAALKLGEAGDADVLIVHAPAAEQTFLEAGHAISRDEVMQNYFVLLGAPADPARIKQLGLIAAFQAIADGEFRFVSRGDNSGTHQRELEIWKAADRTPDWYDYMETGQGMGATLIVADQKQAYTLSDQATLLNFRDKIDLVSYGERDERLRNIYSVLVIDPKKNPRIHAQLAERFREFLLSEPIQKLIGEYRIAEQQLFEPIAKRKQ